MTITFEAEFDVGDKVRLFTTKEEFFVRFVMFGSNEDPVYRCYPAKGLLTHGNPHANDLFMFDQNELELGE